MTTASTDSPIRPMDGLSVVIEATTTPASAALAAAQAQVRLNVAGTSMPSELAATWSEAVARMARPIRVTRNSTRNTPTAARATSAPKPVLAGRYMPPMTIGRSGKIDGSR